MKSLLILLISSISFSATAAKPSKKEAAFTVNFANKTINHTYSLMDNGKSGFSLSFKDGAKTKTKAISRSEAVILTSELNRIAWQSEYRRPANASSCTPYATVKFAGSKETQICYESSKAVGHLYGLLNNLKSEMKSVK